MKRKKDNYNTTYEIVCTEEFFPNRQLQHWSKPRQINPDWQIEGIKKNLSITQKRKAITNNSGSCSYVDMSWKNRSGKVLKKYDARKAPGIYRYTDMLHKAIKTKLPMNEVTYIFLVLNFSIIFDAVQQNCIRFYFCRDCTYDFECLYRSIVSEKA